jgi:hypothetical protein
MTYPENKHCSCTFTQREVALREAEAAQEELQAALKRKTEESDR